MFEGEVFSPCRSCQPSQASKIPLTMLKENVCFLLLHFRYLHVTTLSLSSCNNTFVIFTWKLCICLCSVNSTKYKVGDSELCTHSEIPNPLNTWWTCKQLLIEVVRSACGENEWTCCVYCFIVFIFCRVIPL